MFQSCQTVAQLVVQSLLDNGIDQLYCHPGPNDDFFDVFMTNRIKYLLFKHVMNKARYMALGAALATGKPQACCIVQPGFLNAASAIATAYSTNAPVMTIVGQCRAALLARGLDCYTR